jgi:hypothetical protein
LGRCAMAARQPLELIILVRIQAPQPDFPASKRGFFSENGSRVAAPLVAPDPFYFFRRRS